MLKRREIDSLLFKERNSVRKAAQFAFDSAHDRGVVSVRAQEKQEFVIVKQRVSVVDSFA